jgi:uncharacterized repeat protein (TIGR01451 family)
MTNDAMRRIGAIAVILGLLALPAAAQTRVVVVNGDFTGEGFNDPTPAEPVGGNHGTTVGQQRLLAFEHAANLWAAELDSAVEIRVLAQFDPLSCSATSVILGSAGPESMYADFANAPLPLTWYVGALASRLAREDMDEGHPAISAQFNSSMNGDPDCGGGQSWYYGLDNQPGPNQVDLIVVVLHELAHGLGFSTIGNKGSGELLGGRVDAYATHLFDNALGLRWPQMTDQQRAASARRNGGLSWSGANAIAAVSDFLGFDAILEIHEPEAVRRIYEIGRAEFGAPLTMAGVSGRVVAALDEANIAGFKTTDACTALVNASELVGRVALIDRGTCTFVEKSKRAQDAGAVAVIIANDADGGRLAMSGDDPSITIPVISVSRLDGLAIRNQLSNVVTATVRENQQKRAGADVDGRPLMYAPESLVGGSSVSHWDLSAEPDLLMEPRISPGLAHEVDLTRHLLADIGWYSELAVQATLRYELTTDRDGDGAADEGDAVRFIVEIRNPTEISHGVVRLDVPLPAGLTVIPGSTSGGTPITEGERVTVDAGPLGPANVVTVTFEVTIDSGLPPGTTSVALQGTVSATGLALVTDDPATAAPGDATVVIISRTTATEHRVPSAFGTIQEAIDAAVDGDHVVLDSGTYRESLDLRGKKITLRSSADARATILDGEGLPTAIITAISGESLDTVVEGLTFRNGTGRFTGACFIGGYLGGAIFVQHGGISVRDSIFENNGRLEEDGRRTITGGGAIFACDADLSVTGSTFRSNIAGFGGAIRFVARAHHGTVADSFFEEGRAGHGGGIFSLLEVGSSFSVRGSHFVRNHATHGAGVWMTLRDHTTAEVTSSWFRDGIAAFGGGLNLAVHGRTSVAVTQSDFVGNQAGFGGGIFAMAVGQLPAIEGGRITIDRSRILGNVAEACCGAGKYIDSCFADGLEETELFYGGGADLRTIRGGSIEVTNSLVAGNSGLRGGGAHASSCDGGRVAFTNVTVSENQPSGLHLRLDVPESTETNSPGTIRVANSIVRGNSGVQIPVELLSEGPTLEVRFSNVEGGFEGERNLDLPTGFVDSRRCDYRLVAGTSGIDAGENDALDRGFTTDLDGNPRFVDDPTVPDTGTGLSPIIDLGALEWTPEEVSNATGRRRAIVRPYGVPCFDR